MAKRRAERSTQDLILDTAVDLFARDGFKTTSMDAIAAKAQIAKGSLYYHYESKEGILDAILDRYRDTMESRLAAIEADAALEPLEKFKAAVAALEQVNSSTFQQLHRVRYIDIHEKTTSIMVQRFAPYLARIMEAGARAGVFRVSLPLENAELILVAGQWLFDPESGVEGSPRRVTALSRLVASILGVEERALGDLFAFPRSKLDPRAQSKKEGEGR
jgi:AcrR family transcriptional regulator